MAGWEGGFASDCCACLANPLNYLFFQKRFLRSLFLSSSMVEHPAVNRRVPGSSPG